MLTHMRGDIDTRFIAATRMAIGMGSLLSALENHATLTDIADKGFAVPVLGWLPTVSPAGASAVFIISVLFSTSLLTGYLSRAAAVGLAVTHAFVLLWDQQSYSNHLVLLICLGAYLALTDPVTRWSLDARIRGSQQATVPMWTVVPIMSQISIVYLFTAISKVNPVFLNGDMLRSAMWIQLPEPLYVPLSYCAVALEFFLAFALWSRRLVKVAIALGIMLHVSIVVTLGQPIVLFAFALLTVGTYPLFYARARGARPLASRHKHHGHFQRVTQGRTTPYCGITRNETQHDHI